MNKRIRQKRTNRQPGSAIASGKKDRLHASFLNSDFLLGRDGRAVRILAEFLEPEHRLERFVIRDTLVFFGSARILPRKIALANLRKAKAKSTRDSKSVHAAERDLQMSRYYEECAELSRRLAEWSNTNRYGYAIASGGGPGIMEAANKGAQAGKAPSVGLNILLPFEQQPNSYIDPQLSFEFRYFFMRKFWFVYTAKAIVMFPGGFGTIDEMMELLTLVQTHRITKKMVVVLYGREFWTRVIDFKYLVAQGVISPEDLRLFQLCDSVDEAFAYMTHHLPRNRKKFRLNLEA
ncbi:MAG TPA: TIGR00730 family Rossman fold protein [Fibrobacteres bacterium]|nr:TIGR00730 family Rossman fold protein [Fibrobacterota bacterium]